MRHRGVASQSFTKGALIVVVLPLLNTTALASVDAESKGEAGALFEQGKRAMEGGDYGGACPKLARSQALDPQLGTLLNLAACFESLGQRARACALWQQAAEGASRKGEATRGAFAKERAERVCPTVGNITVAVAEQPGRDRLQVTIDGEPLDRQQWGRATPLDPGEHEFRAVAEGRGTWSKRIWMADRDASLVVPVIAPERSSSSDVSTIAPPANVPRPSLATAAWVSAGVGLVAVGVGSSFGIAAIANQAASNADRSCVANTCNDAGERARARAIDDAHIAEVALAVGAGGLATSLVLWLLAPNAGTAGSSFLVRPLVAREGWRLTVQESWR